MSAIASAIVDHIPYTAIPVVQRLGEGRIAVEPLWWALALGACLGGNLTIAGASANVVVANLAERAGHRIRFVDFLRYGAAVVAASHINLDRVSLGPLPGVMVAGVGQTWPTDL